MLNITFRRAKDIGACVDSYRKVAKVLGGVKKYGLDTPIPLTVVMDVCGADDAIWCMRATLEDSTLAWVEYARQRDLAWAEYERERNLAWPEYERVYDTARAEYERVCDTALRRILESEPASCRRGDVK